MKTKLVSHIENDIWTLVKRSSDRKIITERWVFKLKHDLDDKILRYKTCWIVHDYKQLEEIDFIVTWTEVVKSTSFQTLIAIVIARDLQILQMNIITVFLYDYLKKNIYVSQSNDFVKDFTLVCKLQKALYELKQISRV